MKKAAAVILFALSLGLGALAQEEAATPPGDEKSDPTLALKIGDPKLKNKTMEAATGLILSANKGAPTTFEDMIRTMDSSRFIYVGETHTSMPMHEIQFEVLRALYARDRNLAVGMEMFPVTVQETLNKWSAGLITKDEFIRESQWYINWNYHFGFYEKIFEFAKEHRLPIYALNVPRDIISKIRMRGWEALSDEEKVLIPESPDLTNDDHRTLIRATFENMDMPHQMKGTSLDQVFEGLYRSQSAWDEVMATNTVRGFEKEGRRLVVLAGSGHLVYNLGLNWRAMKKMKAPFTTVIAVPIPNGLKGVTVSRSLADFVVGLPAEEEPVFPSIGLAFKKIENLDNLVVEAKPITGVSASADFEKDDIVLSVDGMRYNDINELRMYLARFVGGGETTFRILRAGTVKDVVLKFSQKSPGN